MGTVYRAVDEMLDREVALKFLDPRVVNGAPRFRAEAVALGKLNHPGIPTVHELFEWEGQLVIALELVSGQTLEDAVLAVGPLPPARAAALVGAALDALAHAHEAGIVHRDLKPSNLMITRSGAVKVMDFGIARQDGAAHLTHAGAIVGTPAYMSPEQVQGLAVDARTDVYAMGIVLYRLLTGTLPFAGATAFAIAQAHLSEAPRPAEQALPDLPPWVPAILGRALAKLPADRFQSAAEFREALALAAAGPADALPRTPEPTQVLPRFPARPRRAWLRRGRPFGKIMWPAVAAIGLAGLAAPAWWRLASDSPPDRSARSDVGVAPVATRPESPTPIDILLPRMPDTTPAPRPPDPGLAPPAVAATSASTGAAISADAGTPDAARASEPATFSDVKLLLVDDKGTHDRDVTIRFENGRITAVPRDDGTPEMPVPARGVRRATYVYARDPLWDASLPGPTGHLKVPGFLGRSKRWLVVQTRSTYVILRLDGDDWEKLIEAFEGHAGVRVVRASASGS